MRHDARRLDHPQTVMATASRQQIRASVLQRYQHVLIMRRYKLRAAVDIDDVSGEQQVWVRFGAQPQRTAAPSGQLAGQAPDAVSRFLTPGARMLLLSRVPPHRRVGGGSSSARAGTASGADRCNPVLRRRPGHIWPTIPVVADRARRR